MTGFSKSITVLDWSPPFALGSKKHEAAFLYDVSTSGGKLSSERPLYQWFLAPLWVCLLTPCHPQHLAFCYFKILRDSSSWKSLHQNTIRARRKSTRMPASIFPFLWLPQELRDYIYEALFFTIYNHPRPGDPVYQICPSSGKVYIETVEQCQSDRLAILQVSKSIHEEAKPIFYKYGTFRFEFPKANTTFRPSFLNTVNLQNIIIDLDFRTIYSSRLGDKETANLVKHFAQPETTLPRQSCTVRIHFTDGLEFAWEWLEDSDALVDAVGGLTGFKTVSVKIAHLIWDREKEWPLTAYEDLWTRWEGTLGKRKEFGWDDAVWLSQTYHPWAG